MKHCARCKTIYNLLPSPNSKSITRLGNLTESYMCRPCNAERRRRYVKTQRGKENADKANARTWSKYPDKLKARITLNTALSSGKIAKPLACSSCKISNDKLQGHHPDYSEPLSVEWLCVTCHARIHRGIK